MEGVTKGYGGTFANFKFDSPDYSKLAALERSVYQFAGAKNWQMMKDLTAALKDGDRVLPFREWNAKASEILGDYEGRWRRVEYDTAISASQMASKCVEYDQHPDDLVEYIDAQDDRECPICRQYHGVKLPWSHPFWRVACPLNHFGCHCSTRRLNSGKRTPEGHIPPFDKIPPLFRQNTAEKGLVFPEGHAYYIGCPKKVLDQALDLLPYERKFEPIHESKAKNELGHPGKVLRHSDVDVNADDYKIIETIAIEKADLGHHVEILPEVNEHETELRSRLLPGVRGLKNPDLRIDGEYVDVKQPEIPLGNNTLTHAIESGAEQANKVIIDITDPGVSEFQLFRAANGKLKQMRHLQEVEYRHRGKYLPFRKKKGS